MSVSKSQLGWLPCLALRSLCLALVVAGTSTLHAEDVVVKIRLINGRNGKPITDENLNIFRNQPHFPVNQRADRSGVINLTIDRNSLVSFASNIQVNYHQPTDAEKSLHELQQYKVSNMMEHGISDTNTCSKKIKVEARPGEFVYFERPRTLWEWMAL